MTSPSKDIPGPRVCKDCGAFVLPRHRYCSACAAERARKSKREYYSRYHAEHPDKVAESLDRCRWNRKTHPVEATVHSRVGSAVRSGKLQRPDTCSRCGAQAEVEAHHEDYTKVYEVTWLCRLCHKARHREIREEA